MWRSPQAAHRAAESVSGPTHHPRIPGAARALLSRPSPSADPLAPDADPPTPSSAPSMHLDSDPVDTAPDACPPADRCAMSSFTLLPTHLLPVKLGAIQPRPTFRSSCST